MGIRTVAVHSTADENAVHGQWSICIGPPSINRLSQHNGHSIGRRHFRSRRHSSRLRILERKRRLRGNDRGTRLRLSDRPRNIRMMGDKITAKRAVKDAGIPVVPGSDDTIADADKAIETLKIRLVLLRPPPAAWARHGGRERNGTHRAMRVASSEAEAAFGNGAVYLEKYLGKRAIEIRSSPITTATWYLSNGIAPQRRHQGSGRSPLPPSTPTRGPRSTKR